MAADLDARIAGVSSLAEPQRRALYRFVVSHGDAVARTRPPRRWASLARSPGSTWTDSSQMGCSPRSTADSPAARGPGAGRPAKLYRRAAGELSVSLPSRHYDVAAALLATAITDAIHTGRPVEEVLHEVATSRGREVGALAREEAGTQASRRALVEAALGALEDNGYEPRSRGREVVLTNCPFHALVEDQRELVCGMNLDLLSGMADALGDDVLTARLEPSDDACCVRLDVSRRSRTGR